MIKNNILLTVILACLYALAFLWGLSWWQAPIIIALAYAAGVLAEKRLI